MRINDAQSRLNDTEVHDIVRPVTADGVVGAVRRAAAEGRPVSVAGGRHAMGGQQFAQGALHLDMTGLDRVVSLDEERGLAVVEAGTQWPGLLRQLGDMQAKPEKLPEAEGKNFRGRWTIRQKQTGVDAVTLGGSVGANIHGRGLRMGPMAADVESLELVDAAGELRRCSRSENAELFSLVVGGYGLFGVVVRVTLRLMRRVWLRRQAESVLIRDVPERIEQRTAEGCLYGDAQFAIDLDGNAAEHRGILSCYAPTSPPEPRAPPLRTLAAREWAGLYTLARTSKRAAFDAYTEHYLATDGQVYPSDTSQLSSAFAGYGEAVDARRGTAVITEVYVRPDALLSLLAACRADFKAHGVDLVYGTIRFIDPDPDTFLPWARQRLACVVCNLHVEHTEAGLAKARDDFRRIIDRAIEHGGHYYLTYHRWARRDQVLTCYPRLPEFLERKQAYDPDDRFRSDWLRHTRALLAEE
ncbi:MAG: FAD-binding oxidoreductase, partial [Planctomycetota bacterium]